MTCPTCGEPTDRPRRYLCETCAARFQFNHRQRFEKGARVRYKATSVTGTATGSKIEQFGPDQEYQYIYVDLDNGSTMGGGTHHFGPDQVEEQSHATV